MQNNQISKLELIQAQISFIPEGWKLDKVGKALVIRNNFRKPISQEVRVTIPGNYPYYGPTKIQGYISDYEQDGVYALIGEDGDHFLKYSKMRQTQFISGKCTVNNHAHIIESSDECDSEWFYIFFKHRNITNFLSRQGAGRFKLNKATLEKLPLLVPPLSEQRKIAKILSAWDKAISTTDLLIDNRKQHKKALMQQLLTGKKRLFDDSGKPFEGEWIQISLGEISHVSSSKRVMKSDYVEHGIPFYRSKEVILKSAGKNLKDVIYISKQQYENFNSKFGSPTEGDILITAVGTLGVPYLVKKDETFYFKDGNLLWLRGIVDTANPDYILFYMKSDQFQNRVKAVTGGSSQKALTIIKLSELEVQLPSIDEQQKVAEVLTIADKEVELLEQQLADLKQEKKALMQQLLTGKRRVKT